VKPGCICSERKGKCQKKKGKPEKSKDSNFSGKALTQGRTGTPFEALAKLTVPGNLP